MTEVKTAKLFNELKRRTIKPWTQETFKIYFFCVVIGFGGLGVWLPNVIKYKFTHQADWANTSNELVTFSIGILISALVDMLLPEKVKNPLKLCCIIALLFGAFVAFLLLLFENLWVAIIFTVIVLWIWWMANADNEELFDPGPIVAIAGDPLQELKGTLDNVSH